MTLVAEFQPETMTARCWSRSLAHQRRAHAVIPGAAHTYAKGDDQYPAHMLPVIARGNGCRVWDLDHNEYVEFGSGVRSVILGHGDPVVCRAAQRAMWDGINFARPAAIELEAAEAFLKCVPSAEMVKFAKNGSDATTAAVKLSRAVTGRSKVAVCRSQPFFSVNDWFIGTVDMAAGIPQSVRDMTVGFPFNDANALRAVLEGGDIACVMLEAHRDEPPAAGYLAEVRRLCDEFGSLLVIDETISGFRLHVGGAHALHGVEPDLSTFGKGMGNGFSVACLAGKREFMERGGLTTDKERVFLLSLTHGGETHGLAAGIATMNTIREQDIPLQLARSGRYLAARVTEAAAAADVSEHFQVAGHPSNLIYVTKDADGKRSQAFRTLFLQETLRRGLLAPNLVVSAAHTVEDLDWTAEIIADALAVYRRALDEGIEHHLESRPVQPVFRRFN